MSQQRQEQANHLTRSVLILSLFLFGVGLLPRLLTLDAFLTPDEFHWVRRSRDFLAGMLSGDWMATLQTGHPGVTTMWTGSLGILYRYLTRPSSAPDDLLTFVGHVPSDPIHVSYIAPTRFPTVILTSLAIVAFFLFATRLFDRRTGLIASCLLALNPLYIAHSRVLHHDALATTFMTLSLLPMLGFWAHGWGRRWLLVSGVMAGLAFLSKSSAMLLMPFCAIVGVWSFALGWREGRRTGWRALGGLILDGALWGVVAWLTYGLLWPAMWTDPLGVLATVFDFAMEHANEPHVLGQYFLGGYVQDAGPLFYPLVWLLRTTPLNLLGLAALLIFGRRRDKLHPGDKRMRTTIYLCVIYVLFSVVMMSLGAKKQDRYILPVFPALDLLAGLGLVRLWQSIGGRWSGVQNIALSEQGYRLLFAAVLVVQGVFALPHHPYYLTYYNPLLGGARTAQRLVTLGWGEGLDLAATYLNQKPNAEDLKVTAWYHSAFEPYFKGHVTHFFSAGRQMDSDYLVVYQNQLQRQMPDPYLLDYYQRHYTPEYVVRLKGIDYAKVYAVPLERRADWQSSQVPDKLILYGYRQINAQPGLLTLRFVWENQGMAADEGLWAALEPLGASGLLTGKGDEGLAWQPCRLPPDFSLAEARQVGGLAESECELHTAHLEPGIYSLHFGLGPPVGEEGGDALPLNSEVVDLLGPRGDLGVSVSDAPERPELLASHQALDAVAKAALPPGALPLHVSYGGVVALVGYEVVSPSPQSNTATVRLYWRALRDLPQPASLAQEYRVRFDFIAPDGGLITGVRDDLFGSIEMKDVWRSGEVLAASHQVSLSDGLPSGDYRLAVALARTDSDELVPVLDEATGLLTTDYVRLEIYLIAQ